MSLVEVRIPDLGDVKDAGIVEILVEPGSTIGVEDPLLTLESDKASMDVPSPVAGVIREIKVKKGDRVGAGSLFALVETAAAAASTTAPSPAQPPPTPAQPPPTPAQPSPSPAPARQAAPQPTPQAAPPRTAPGAPPAGALDLVVLGAGPGGYTAAFRAADLGMSVTLVERWPTLGGVCLNVGCIPSKALLHAAKVLEEAESMADCGIVFAPPQIDLDRLRAWKNRVVGKLTGGLQSLAKQRKVTVVHGDARLVGAHAMEVATADGVRRLEFKQCIIAAGSESVRLPGFPDDPRVIDSTGALELPAGCKRLLVVGGGIIGLEMACVYDALGAQVSVVELSPGLMPGADPDLVRPLQKRIEKRYQRVLLGTKVARLEALPGSLRATFEGPGAPEPQEFDRVLVAVGRKPNGNAIGAAAAGVAVDARGIIPVDKQMRTNVPHIFAIGDIAGAPMLAHKATHEAKVAAEVAAGHKAAFDARCIPSVAYTDPEIAWVGVTETEAKARGLAYGKAVFPWAASGRSLAINRDEGFTKLLFDKETRRVIGGGIVGTNAGELIAEVGLAIELGADAADIGLTVHAHPTLSETVAMSAEAFEGTLTDMYLPKR
ncbi:MAG: dihydrolipoyl dehydrogenase [Gammaproteobacteria bacterium]|nr:dihydrolipoyl dehydrogenase [Gammaproteobacteria bacterium]